MATHANKPLVSIVIPTYNRAHLIAETIQSIIDQTYSNWELIIVDDGSTDQTVEVIQRFNDKRIIYKKISHSGIFGRVRNEGLKLSQGEYLAFLDSDDLWRFDKIAVALSLLQQYPEAGFVINNVQLFGDTADVSPECEDFFLGYMLKPLLLENRFTSYPSALFFRRSVINTIGWMDEQLPYGTDTEYLFRMSHSFKGIFVNERLTSIRKHSTNISSGYDMNIYVENIQIIKKLHQQGILTKKEYRSAAGDHFYKIGLSGIYQNQKQLAINSYLQYISLHPLYWKGWVRLFQSLLLRFT